MYVSVCVCSCCVSLYSDRRESLTEFDDLCDDDVVILHDTSPEYAQQTLETMKLDIKKHMHQVCQWY